MDMKTFKALPLGKGDEGWQSSEHEALAAMKAGEIITVAEEGCNGPGECPIADALVLVRRASNAEGVTKRFETRHGADGTVAVACISIGTED